MSKGMKNIKKKVISIILIGMMVHSVYACGSIASKEADYDEINEPVQEESSETETVQDNEIPEETEDTLSNSEVQQAVDEESAEPIYIIEPGLTQDDTYEVQDWQAAYVEYIEGLEQKEYYKCSLIYVDDDDIPELVITTNIEADGCYILTFHNGEVDALRTARLNFCYLEKQNLINNSDGHMGYYYDIVYSIENGKWVCVAVGEWTETYVVEDDAVVYRYEWEGEEVKEEVYEAKLDEIFDWKQAKYPEYVKSDEMLLRLQTEDNDMTRTHRYELYVEDITWDEANWSSSSYEYTNYINYSDMEKYWVDGEPGYSRRESDEPIERLSIYLLYDDAKENCYLYNAPKDMLMRNPEYTGKIGYICEYDSKGNITKTCCQGVGSTGEYEYEREYDNMGNETKYVEYRQGEMYEWYECECITIIPQ